MKDLKIPVLFAVAAIVFSFISMMSCQNEDSASEEQAMNKTEQVQEERISQLEEPIERNEIASSTNMRFGPR